MKIMRTKEEMDAIVSLGSGHTEYKTVYDPCVLECFSNKHEDMDYIVKLNCNEFTTLCPKTGQPDFGKLVISYIPDKFLVESKSLKLYLFSFRNNGDFHEDVVNIIKKDLIRLLSPKYIEVVGIFAPRGGIAIYPYASFAREEYKSLEARRMERFLNGIE